VLISETVTFPAEISREEEENKNDVGA